MSDETRRVLDLLAQGKITADQAAELLKALGGTRQDAKASAAQEPRPGTQPRYIRISVRKKAASADASRRVYAWPGCMAGGHMGAKEVNIRVPMSLVRSGMRLGAVVPGGADFISQALRDRGMNVDLSKVSPEQLEAILKEMGELTVDVDHGRAQVSITAE